MILKVKYLDNYNKDWERLKYQHFGDSGIDLRAAVGKTLNIWKNRLYLIPTGIMVEIELGYEIQIRPRSGLAAKGLIITNSPGTIDSKYRGEIKVMVYMLHTENIDDRYIRIEPGDRIAQAVVCQLPQVTIEEVAHLSDVTVRGANGFGSTGMK